MQQEDDNKPTLLQKVVQLPDVIVDIIKEYIPKRVWAFTNRENYELYHKYLKPSINNYENYIRDTIRRDNFFVFEKIVRENFNIWWNIHSYTYKNMIFKKYLYFTLHYFIDNDSTNCRNVIIQILKEHGFDKNLHKKNIVKYIRWKN